MHSPIDTLPVPFPDVSSSLPRQAHAHHLQLSNGDLTWTSQDGIQPLAQKDIIFILEAPSQSEKTYIICLLQEKPDSLDAPYQLNLLLSRELPEDLLRQYLLTSFPDHLDFTNHNNKVDIIVSTKSGTGLALKCWESVVQPLLVLAQRNTTSDSSANPTSIGQPGVDAPQQYNLLVTQNAQSVRQFSRDRWAARQVGTDGAGSTPKTETIVLLSGDGGIVDLLNGCEDTEIASVLPTIAVLPLGTGNALFHSLHKSLYTETGPSPLVLGLRTLFRGKSAPLPSFRASFSPGSRLVTYKEKNGGSDPDTADLERQETEVDHLFGAIVASYGFHASLVWESDTPEYRKHGDKRFGMVAQELLKESHGYKARVETSDGGSLPQRIDREEFGYVLATMVSNLEKAFTISPASKPLESQLRLVHFGAVGGAKTMEIMMEAYKNGNHVGMRWKDDQGREDYVGYDAIEELKVTILETDPRWRKVCIDGTIVEVAEGGWMAVRKMDAPHFHVLVDGSVL